MSNSRYPLYRAIHGRLRKMGMEDEKEGLVYNWTDGRTSSLKEMRDSELRDLADHLLGEATTKLRQPRRAIVHTLCLADPDRYAPSGAPDYDAINRWCIARTAAKKALLEQTYHELTQTLRTAKAYQRANQPKE